MKYVLFSFLLLTVVSCQSVKIKNATYKTTESNLEIGSLGQSKRTVGLQNGFETKTFPKLENKIRLDIEVLPYTKNLHKIYTSKAKFNQAQSKIVYADSLPVKPEVVVVRLYDVTGFVGELNADYNKEVYKVIDNLQNAEIVSSVVLQLPNAEITKIKQADAYYLNNVQDKKYTVVLYKQGKKTESIDLTIGTMLAYGVSKFCWSQTERGKWYVADMVNSSSSCVGKMTTKVKNKKKEEHLFRM